MFKFWFCGAFSLVLLARQLALELCSQSLLECNCRGVCRIVTWTLSSLVTGILFAKVAIGILGAF